MTMVRALGITAVTLGVAAPFAGSPFAGARGRLDVAALAAIVSREEDHVTALELAAWIRDRKAGLRILDVRDAAAFQAAQIPGAEHLPIDRLDRARFDPADTLVLYSDGGAHAAQAWVLLRALGYQQVFFLRGGLNEWLDDVMNPAQSTELTRYFGGVARDPDAAPSAAAQGSTDERVRRMRRRGC